ncbi:Protein of unknown function [Bacillus toyonensis]|nr:Protein of unknown function [Bacillus toyonensis]
MRDFWRNGEEELK